MNFRPSAVPLIAVDPYFSIWSFADELYQDVTRHWTGRKNEMNAGVKLDGKYYALMGILKPDPLRCYVEQYPVIPQTGLKITPLSSTYYFKNETVAVALTFTTPLLLDRLDILSRPASYIAYEITVLDGGEHDISFYFDISAECCVDCWNQNVTFQRNSCSLSCGNQIQKVLGKSGDAVCIDWGYLHLAHKNARVIDGRTKDGKMTPTERNIYNSYNAYNEYPYLAVEVDGLEGVVTVAYDDVKSIEYFGEQLDPYYKKYFADFEAMLETAVPEYCEVKTLCDDFDKRLVSDSAKFGEAYQNLTALAYRQVIAAHKLVETTEGELLFLSKECYSNGCIGTLDVSYPSIPLFLKYNPEMIKGMLRPILRYAQSEQWIFEFAPHDVGQYPLANGQIYGENKLEYQMPVEECGNMLLCVAALCKAENDVAFAEEHHTLLKQWADYLLQEGYDPGNQLCTDDFAGHLAHNCNLSLKAICAVGAFGKMFGEQTYMDAAKQMSGRWCKEAYNAQGISKLAFDCEDSWSLKYNIVWDKLLGLSLFEEAVFKNEIKQYLSKQNRYGVPLDSRADYTKLDWLAWTTVMTDDREYREKVYSSIEAMVNETPSRAPLTDWYDTVTAKKIGFQNRSVLGGLFINLLCDE